ncbi:MAG: bifunctional diaminohydroxyphosphoribosylaminopyrimidine deaminase/5-amino-6-(5-phosphoribosylamino)uracil reductase RibD [Muribaculaceae bacterium]|nr:bifunctional diaminohydroxyphosphoribosylaminopyrimidine deaminase/5-amino-6-(5-phosphoribosylamino)uracil reductase RibD [Muribaculaceae bacterium]
MTEQERNDITYMRRAIQIAMKGASHVSPNPMVGAVVVCHNRIIGEGFHRLFGAPHAEVNAINSVCDKSLLSESTLYVTLEPCSHYGKTPPCARLIIDMKIPRVVIGSLDPNEKVSGRGVKILEDAGIDVKVGVLREECLLLNEHFILAHTHRRPYVLLKWAQTADGVIGFTDANGVAHPLSISSSYTEMLMHRERSFFDAILIGAKTYIADSPKLTVRRWHIRQNPLRIVLDPNASLLPHFLKFPPQQHLVWVVNNIDSSDLPENIEVMYVDNGDINDLLRQLFQRSVTSLMVEGGATTLQYFINARLYDQIRVEVSSDKVVLPDGSTPIIAPSFNANLKNVEFHLNKRIFNYSPSDF